MTISRRGDRVRYYRGRQSYEMYASLRDVAAGRGHQPCYTLLALCYHAVSLLPEVYFFTMFPGIMNANFLLLFLKKKHKFSVLRNLRVFSTEYFEVIL